MQKYYKYIYAVLALCIFAFGATAFADTQLGFYPVTVSVKQGQKFNITVKVDPQGSSVYTVGMDASFPSDLVSLETWKYDQDWMPIRKPGYDYFSNTEGRIVRTAGYANGVSSKVVFGTATFVALKTGTATIVFSDKSLALDANNKNVYSGGNKATITIEQPAAVATTTTKPEVKPEIKNPEPGTVAPPVYNIELSLDGQEVANLNNLGASVKFSGFGKDPTQVKMVFDVLDNKNYVVHSETAVAVIENGGVFNKGFESISLPKGNYTLRLQTLYNNTVSNQFVRPFSITAEETGAYWIYWPVGVVVLLLVICLLILMSSKRRARKHRAQQE